MKILMMGDSTMKRNNFYSYPQFGWGQGIEEFTKENILVFNYAENGRSTKSFIDEGRFQRLLDNTEKGDYVICSFGHNDEKIQDPNRYTDPFGQYKKNLKFFKDEVEKKGATIVYATSTTRHKFENGVCVNTHGDYPKAMMEFAKETNSVCVDLNKLTMDMYTELGEERSKRLHLIYPENSFFNTKDAKDDHSHLTMEGAVMVAYQFVKAITKMNAPILECFIDIKAQNMVDLKMLID